MHIDIPVANPSLIRQAIDRTEIEIRNPAGVWGDSSMKSMRIHAERRHWELKALLRDAEQQVA